MQATKKFQHLNQTPRGNGLARIGRFLPALCLAVATTLGAWLWCDIQAPEAAEINAATTLGRDLAFMYGRRTPEYGKSGGKIPRAAPAGTQPAASSAPGAPGAPGASPGQLPEAPPAWNQSSPLPPAPGPRTQKPQGKQLIPPAMAPAIPPAMPPRSTEKTIPNAYNTPTVPAGAPQDNSGQNGEVRGLDRGGGQVRRAPRARDKEAAPPAQPDAGQQQAPQQEQPVPPGQSAPTSAKKPPVRFGRY